MPLTEVILRDLIEPCFDNNSDERFGIESVKGISIQKCFIETKANMEDVSLKPYIVVGPNNFAYVPTTSRNGEKITIAFNDKEESFIVSSSYQVFRVKDVNRLLPEYLFILFCRAEFDRYSRFNSWGSAREVFSFQDMCSIKLKLPSIEIQQKAVDAYNAIKSNLAAYEEGIADLKLTCQAYIEKLAKKYPSECIAPYITEIKEKNTNLSITLEQGINIEKQFITPQRSNSDLSSRVIVKNDQFAFCTQLNNENVAIAYRKGPDCVVSPVYSVFEIIQKEKLLPEYLFLWLLRSEFGRYVYWAAGGSAYEFLKYETLSSIKIPIPPLEIQKSIADIYNVQIERQEIAVSLKNKLRELCPVLISQSIAQA